MPANKAFPVHIDKALPCWQKDGVCPHNALTVLPNKQKIAVQLNQIKGQTGWQMCPYVLLLALQISFSNSVFFLRLTVSWEYQYSYSARNKVCTYVGDCLGILCFWIVSDIKMRVKYDTNSWPNRFHYRYNITINEWALWYDTGTLSSGAGEEILEILQQNCGGTESHILYDHDEDCFELGF